MRGWKIGWSSSSDPEISELILCSINQCKLLNERMFSPKLRTGSPDWCAGGPGSRVRGHLGHLGQIETPWNPLDHLIWPPVVGATFPRPLARLLGLQGQGPGIEQGGGGGVGPGKHPVPPIYLQQVRRKTRSRW